MNNCCNSNLPLVNTYDQIDSLCYQIIQYLMLNNENIWKLLKYDTADALFQENLTMREKASLIYDSNDDTSDYRVFRAPFMDDIFDKRCSQLRIYLTSISPDARTYGTVDIGIEFVVHTKLINLAEYKNRIESMIKEVLKTLNGVYIGGLGQFMFDRNISFYDLGKMNLYNNRNFYGFTLVMSTKVGTVDDC